MKWLSGGLTFVNVATICALLLGLAAGGLCGWIAVTSFMVAFLLAALACFGTRRETDAARDRSAGSRSERFWHWLLAACFAFFAFRSFCWLLYRDNNQLKVQSINNLGDLALHIAYIRNFASGVRLWPENPIYVFSHLRYPAGTDLFNSLLLLLGMDLQQGLVWAGLIGSAATFFALYRWGGAFGVAGFLFNGGLAGFQLLTTWKFADYQGDKTIAWKSLPLSMFVTQRGLLYALPAGLLLLCHWRAKYAAPRSATFQVADEGAGKLETCTTTLLPFWVEVALYATMPLFHIHTFMALSLVAAFLFLLGDGAARKQLALLVGIAFLPATYFVWTITDHFQASSLVQWKPGWVQGSDDFAAPFLRFWVLNFGLLPGFVLILLGLCGWRAYKTGRLRTDPALAFLAPATVLFLFACFVKTAPWEWDNIKLILWAYLIMLPFLWTELLGRCAVAIRVAVCAVLFMSGFVSLFGGLVTNKAGFAIADRPEVDAVGSAVRKLPNEARFAAYPTYNHPLLLQGRKVVLGYPGHLWTQGFDYTAVEKELTALMEGAPTWAEEAKRLRVRYLFWGREEKSHYATSTRPWETSAQLIASGDWGAIYDLQSTPQIPVVPRQ